MNRKPYFLMFFLGVLAACGGGGDGAKSDAAPDVTEPDACEGRDDGTPCGLGKICLDGTCRTSICGDGYVDALLGEECDDGDLVEGDGCEIDCTFSCHTDEDCDDGTVCTGVESCVEVEGGKACQSGVPLNCSGDDPCRVYTCDPVEGCMVDDLVECYRDDDGDGFPNQAASAPADECACPPGYITKHPQGLWDCNDETADVRPNQTSYFDVPYCENGAPAEPNGAIICGGGKPPKTCPKWECEDGSAPSWDYNCDDVATLRWTVQGFTACVGNCLGTGWTGTWTPPCGGSAEQRSCKPIHILNDCTTSLNTKRQECR